MIHFLSSLSPSLRRSSQLGATLVAWLLWLAQPLFAAPIDPSRLPSGGWKPGIPGSIPTNYAMFVNVKTGALGTGGTYSGKLAAGDGVTDDTDAINAALSACPDGKYVYVPAGTYLIKGNLQRTGINNYDGGPTRPFSVILRGAGADKTHFRWAAGSGNGITLTSKGNISHYVSANYVTGATQLTLDSAQYFAPGQWIMLSVPNSIAFDGTVAASIPGYMVDTFAQMAKITAISGNTITLDRPMRWTFGTNTKVTVNISPPYRTGLEDFSIENTSGAGLHNIAIFGGMECWVKGVESINPVKWHIRMENCAGCELRRNYVHGFAAGSGGGDSVYGYGLFNRTGETLVEDNIGVNCRHTLITEYGGQGNVFGYNYSKDPINENQLNTDYLMGDMIQHGGLPHWNLWEGNVGATIKLDIVLAGSRYLTFFRNQVQRKGLPATYVADFAVDIQKANYYANIVGNVYEAPKSGSKTPLYRWGSDGDDTSNLDPLAQSTTYLHGNYDTATDATTWNTSNSDHVLLDSLYLGAKPTWWDSGVWPAIGPEFSTKAGGNPAFRRWSQQTSSIAPPQPPVSLRLIQ